MALFQYLRLHNTLVLPEHSTINADVLLGADFVSACGGLKLDYNELGVLESVFLGPQPPVIGEQETNVCEAVDDDVNAAATKLSRHVTVTKDGEDVVLTVNDGEARWKEEEGFWEVAWQWSSGEEPQTIGHGTSEYSRARLTQEQEQHFCKEVDGWISNGWLLEHNPEVHGQPACVLPLMAVVQEHQASTPWIIAI